MKLVGWIQDPKQHLRIESDLKMAIVQAFRRDDIEIPYPQHDLRLRAPGILSPTRRRSSRVVRTAEVRRAQQPHPSSSSSADAAPPSRTALRGDADRITDDGD